MSEIRFVTQIKAIDNKTGELCTWRGQDVYAKTIEEAVLWADENAGYLDIVGYQNEVGEIVYIEKAVMA